MVLVRKKIEVSLDEIVAGLILHLDPEALEAGGGVYTCSHEKRVKGSHFFLCLHADPVTRSSTWLPLYSNCAVEGEELSVEGRSGHKKWTESRSFYHKEQVWYVPMDTVIRAAVIGNDLSSIGSRNRLDSAHLPELA